MVAEDLHRLPDQLFAVVVLFSSHRSFPVDTLPWSS
jgi:hypothetical protein